MALKKHPKGQQQKVSRKPQSKSFSFMFTFTFAFAFMFTFAFTFTFIAKSLLKFKGTTPEGFEKASK